MISQFTLFNLLCLHLRTLPSLAHLQVTPRVHPPEARLSTDEGHRQHQIEVRRRTAHGGQQLLMLVALGGHLLDGCRRRRKRKQTLKLVAVHHVVALDGLHDLGKLQPQVVVVHFVVQPEGGRLGVFDHPLKNNSDIFIKYFVHNLFLSVFKPYFLIIYPFHPRNYLNGDFFLRVRRASLHSLQQERVARHALHGRAQRVHQLLSVQHRMLFRPFDELRKHFAVLLPLLHIRVAVRVANVEIDVAQRPVEDGLEAWLQQLSIQWLIGLSELKKCNIYFLIKKGIK